MKNLNKVLLIGFVLLLAIVWVQRSEQKYQTKVINSYVDAIPELKDLDQNALVLLDVDDTLISSPDALARTSNFPLSFKFMLLAKHPSLIKSKNFENAWSIMWQQAPRVLIEPMVAGIIGDLQNKGMTVLALTSMESGPYGVIESMPEWRYSMLKGMGVELSQRYADTVFTEFAPYRSNHPVLYKGILCANQQDKGKVLDAFLKYSGCKPSKIVSFDDDANALQSIGKTCEQHNIPSVLFNYRSDKFHEKLNTQRALRQFGCLISHEHRFVQMD